MVHHNARLGQGGQGFGGHLPHVVILSDAEKDDLGTGHGVSDRKACPPTMKAASTAKAISDSRNATTRRRRGGTPLSTEM